MVRKVFKLAQVAVLVNSPPPSLSPLHVSNYSLPTSSRLPKFMIAAVAGFILVTTAAYYFCKWICFRKCLNNVSNVGDTESSSTGGHPEAASQEEIRERTNKALAQRLGSRIAMAIPTMTYAQLVELRGRANRSREEVESEACAVCLSEFSKNQSGSVVKLLPKCAHAFHSTCIDLWLSTQASCPVCRANLFTLFSSCSLTSCPSPDNQPQGDGDNNV